MMIEPVRITPEGMAYAGDEDGAILELDQDPNFRSAGPVHYDVKAILVTGQLIVTGTVKAPIMSRCSRCGVETRFEVTDSRFACDREIKDVTLVVDLTEDLRESILLALPPYPVCKAECRGLCPHCGVNLNKESCSCKPAPALGWDALGKLKL